MAWSAWRWWNRRLLHSCSPEGPSSGSGWVTGVISRTRGEASSSPPWSEPTPWKTAICGADAWSVCSLGSHLQMVKETQWMSQFVWIATAHFSSAVDQQSHLYLSASEKGFIQGHSCPNRLFVCKLNVSKTKSGRKKKDTEMSKYKNERQFWILLEVWF